MVDTATTSLRARKQSLASNQNVWGDPYLNTNLDIFDAGTTKFQTLTTTGGTYTLTSTDYDAGAESIAAGLYISGALGSSLTIVAPGRRKITAIRNATTGNQTVTWGVTGGVQVTIPSNARGYVYTDGTDAFQLTPWYSTSGRIINLTDPAQPQDAATKAYVDAYTPNQQAFFSYTVSSTTTDTNPGSGGLQFSNFTTQSGSTWIYLSTFPTQGGDDSAWLDTLDDSTQSNARGTLLVRSTAAANNWMLYTINTVSSRTGYRALGVTYLAGSQASPFSSAINVTLQTTRAGDGGPIGPTGATGPTGPQGPTGSLTGGNLLGALEEVRAPDVLSASTTDIWTTSGNYLQITGSGTILSFGTAPQSGASRTVFFAGVNTLTHSAGLLILPNSGANITTASGDRAVIRADDIGVARVINYTLANGRALAPSITPTGVVQFTNSSRLLGTTSGIGPGAGIELSLSQALDLLGGAAHGTILYRGATNWAYLPAGTSGSFLKTQGTGANPAWDTVSAGWTVATVQATTSGTAFDFTGIPSTAKQIAVMFNAVGLNGTDNLLVQIGDAGGIETSSYTSISGDVSNNVTSTAGFVIRQGNAANAWTGIMYINLFDASAFRWVATHGGGVNVATGGGVKALSEALTQVRVTRTGTDTFDAGSVTVAYI